MYVAPLVTTGWVTLANANWVRPGNVFRDSGEDRSRHLGTVVPSLTMTPSHIILGLHDHELHEWTRMNLRGLRLTDHVSEPSARNYSIPSYRNLLITSEPYS